MTEPTRWDIVVRLTHWTIAFLFLANFFVVEEGSDIHEWAGYALLVALGIRLLWGMVVDSPAALRQFLPSVSKALAHLREVFQTHKDDHLGHNPAGAMMVWALWTLLILTSVSGILMETDRFWGEEWLEEVHEVLANMTLAAVIVHVSAVVIMSRLTGRNYLSGMTWLTRSKD
ncbi:cytochrome b/b6 domain-containing protein [Enterovibrio paralichthyis]|uniref:cytochrome b/b6 domain-containing protein n=1 Tax=Enterovibrio paralichthyis TaxID=2853805 RepID=UPI001C4637D7|nr:cytochrome b/b6 domain-containing protein [Enterovibrio paralichthyis]MBV7297453.1 cytochrome b/b6 domain-containing protein [Enterovibrio paralichthyis]